MSRIGSAMKAAMVSFKKSYFDTLDEDAWTGFDARRSRYSIFWGYYENTAYDTIHTWAKTLKFNYRLYESIRNLVSPGFVVAEFFKDHVFGGILDPEAKDTGAIPIYTDDESLRLAIADIWKYSQWPRNKNLFVLKGSIYGDVGLRVVDTRSRVYLEIIDPALVKNVELDAFGNVRAYTLEYSRLHPDNEHNTVTYREEVARDGEFVTFETFMNDSPFAYPDNIDRTGTPRESWKEAYGFVPFVWIKHIDVGEDFGWSEFYPGLSKFRELDDQTSLLSDQIRKTIRPAWLIKGAKPSDMTFPETNPTTRHPQPQRQETNLVYAHSSDVELEPWIAKLDISGAIENIKQLQEALERDYPELALHRLRTEGNVISGRALRIAQMPAETRVAERRGVYDNALKTGLQMAMSIGGFRGIYSGIDLNSYRQGKLDFKISEREIFKVDPMDQSEINKEFWEAAKMAVDAGVSLPGYLEHAGYTEEDISTLLSGNQEEANGTRENTDPGRGE